MGYFPEAGYVVPAQVVIHRLPENIRKVFDEVDDNWDRKCLLDTVLGSESWPEDLPRPEWFYCVAGQDLVPDGALEAGELYAVYSPGQLFRLVPRDEELASQAVFCAFAQQSDLDGAPEAGALPD